MSSVTFDGDAGDADAPRSNAKKPRRDGGEPRSPGAARLRPERHARDPRGAWRHVRRGISHRRATWVFGLRVRTDLCLRGPADRPGASRQRVWPLPLPTVGGRVPSVLEARGPRGQAHLLTLLPASGTRFLFWGVADRRLFVFLRTLAA